MLNFNELQLLCLYIDDFARNNIENALLGQRLSVEYRKYDAVNGSLNFSSKKKYRLIILFIDLKYDAYLQLLRASKEQFENVNFIIIDDKIEPDKMPELLNFGVCDIVFTKHINRLSVSVQLALNRFIGEIQNNEKLNSYRQISNISRTGGWELNLKNNRLFWSSVTKEIHEVSQNFEPDLNSGINFYKKGWSRKTIQKAIENAIENGESYDLKLIIVTANNNERWIRAMGKAEIENGICTRIFGTFRDITDQHELTTQLRNTNTRLTALLESIGGASFQIKVDKKEVFTIHYISSGFEKMHELSIDEVTNDSSLLIKVVHPDFRKFMIEKSQDAIKNHKVYEAKFKIFTKSGIEKWIQTYGVPSIDPEGNQIFNVVSWDISKQMFESEQIKLLSLVAQKTTNTVIITDRNGDIKWVNDGFYRLTGYTLNEVQGKNPGKLLQGINTNPDDIDKLKNAIEAEEPLQVEILNYRKDGLSYWVEIFLDPIFDQFGRLQEFIAIQRDITERKRRQKNLQDSNQSLRRALDELKYQKFALDEHSIVSTTDAQGIITYANSKFCEISKYPLSEIIGKNHRIINSGYHDSAFFKEMYRTIYNGKTWNGEIKNRAKDGSYYWVDTTIVPYRDKVGNRAKGFISIRTDITDKMENLSHLKNKNKNLEEIAWAQSHELRAPLANILGLVNLLKDNTFDDKKTKELVHHLSVSSNEMDVVIGKIVRLCEKVDEM